MPSILSININNQTQNKYDLLREKLHNNGINSLPDLIFTQEHNKSFLHSRTSLPNLNYSNYNDNNNNSSLSTNKKIILKTSTSTSSLLLSNSSNYSNILSNYKEYHYYGNHCERVGVFYNINKINNPQKELKIIANFKSSSYNYLDFPLMTRYGFILKYKHKLIANIHLEGGRFSDNYLSSDTNIEKLTKFKMELLKDVMTYKPDIILGDFNSQLFIDKYNIINDILQFENETDETRFKYFTDYIKCNKFDNLDNNTLKLLAKYNNEPHNYLQNNNYNIKCSNLELVNSSSIGKSVIDAIYFKNNSISPKLGCIIDCGNEINTYFGGLSDHNPIYLKYNSLTAK